MKCCKIYIFFCIYIWRGKNHCSSSIKDDRNTGHTQTAKIHRKKRFASSFQSAGNKSDLLHIKCKSHTQGENKNGLTISRLKIWYSMEAPLPPASAFVSVFCSNSTPGLQSFVSSIYHLKLIKLLFFLLYYVRVLFIFMAKRYSIIFSYCFNSTCLC